MDDLKQFLKKTWHFIWESDSLLSWAVNIILAFLLIYFIVYPGLGFFFQTTHPIVAVVSGSMEHDGSFDDWWQTQEYWYSNYNISKEEFKEFPFKNGFNKGDIMVLRGTAPEDIEIGNVIVFWGDRPDPIIHRLISKDPLQTKGDHNLDQLSYEHNIPLERTVGYDKHEKISKAILRIPYLGYVKIWFVENPMLFILVVSVLVLLSSYHETILKLMRKK